MRSVESIGQAGASILTGVLVDVVPLNALLDAQATVYIVCGALAYGLTKRYGTARSVPHMRADAIVAE